MNEVINIKDVEAKVLTIRNTPVLLDRDVAFLYGVETKRINEAVRNNPDKFPEDYMFALEKGECEDLRSKISSTNLSSKSRALPKVFTEKGLYMLATILKGRRAIETTFAIIETFAKVRTLKRELLELHQEGDETKKAALVKHFGETLMEIVMPDPDQVETESSLELNFLIGKLKHTVKKIKRSGE